MSKLQEAESERVPYEAPVLVRLDVNTGTELIGGLGAKWRFPHLLAGS